MKILGFIFLLGAVLTSCNNSSNSDNSEKTEQQTSTEFSIIGKWMLYEDTDKRGLTKERGTFIFKKNGEFTMFRNTKDQKNGKYEFSAEFKTLSIEGEIVDIEIKDNDNILLKGEHNSGNKFESQLVRQK